jgi:hypothetical protein
MLTVAKIIYWCVGDINERVWSKGGMIPTGENRGTGTETCHSAAVCTTNTTQTGLGSTRTYAVTYCMSRTFIQLTKSLDSDYARCWTVQGSNPGRGNNFSHLHVQTRSGVHIAPYSKSTRCSSVGTTVGT